MPWPNDNLSTTHVDSGSDDPSQARSGFKNLIDAVKDIIGSRAAANGVCELNASSKVPNTRIGRGSANGVASLDGNSKVPRSQLPAATASAKGVVELADQAESNALSNTTKPVPPGRIPTASTTQKGVVELATQSEVNNRTATDKAVPPAYMPPLGVVSKFTEFTANGTWTRPSGVTRARFHVIGGGGGGEGNIPLGQGNYSAGGRGARGGYIIAWLDVSASSSYAVTVGAGGAGGVGGGGNNGSSGGQSKIAIGSTNLVVANGGGGGGVSGGGNIGSVGTIQFSPGTRPGGHINGLNLQALGLKGPGGAGGRASGAAGVAGAAGAAGYVLVEY